MKILVPNWLLQERIGKLATKIGRWYGGELPLFVVVLDGALQFSQALFTHFERVDQIGIRCKSYTGTKSGELRIDEPHPEVMPRFWARDVLIVEDMVDSGKTLVALAEKLKRWGAKDVRAVAMLKRHSSPPLASLVLATTTTIANDAFVVGFGLDHDGKYRELPDVCEMKQP